MSESLSQSDRLPGNGRIRDECVAKPGFDQMSRNANHLLGLLGRRVRCQTVDAEGCQRDDQQSGEGGLASHRLLHGGWLPLIRA